MIKFLSIIMLVLFVNLSNASQCPIFNSYEVKGNKESIKAAIECWKIEAEKGDACAQAQLGGLYHAINMDSEAIKWDKKAADQGNTTAQFNLGVFYSKNGQVKEAMMWYHKSAEAGNPSAQFNLARMYKNQGNVKEMLKWDKSAAEQGIPQAQNNLGSFYEEQGNVQEAFKWYKKAADLGDKTAPMYMAQLHSKQGNIEESIEWLHKLIKYGKDSPLPLEDTQFILAHYYQKLGNTKEAIRWLKEAAANGSVEAKKRLSKINTTNKVPGTNVAEKILPFHLQEKSWPSLTLSQLSQEIKQLNKYVGWYPPSFNSEEEREAIYRKWLKLASDAEAFARSEKTEEVLAALSELYRQGHNMDVEHSHDKAISNLNLCLEKYPKSVECNFSAAYFYMSVDPKYLSRAETSLNTLRQHFAPKLNADVESQYVFLYLHQKNDPIARQQIDKFIKNFPNDSRVSVFKKIRPALEK